MKRIKIENALLV